MDTRTYSSLEYQPGIEIIQPTFTGKAKTINKKSIENQKYDNITIKLINECFSKMSEKTFDFKKDISLILEAITNSKKCLVKQSYDDHIVSLITYALTNDDLGKKDRSQLCKILLEGVNGFFENKGFVLQKYEILISLFSQLEMDIEDNIKSNIKNTMLKFIMYDGQNGVIHLISNLVSQYLNNKPTLAEMFIFTIINLAKDKMEHQKYNLEYYNSNHSKKIKFTPNKTPHLLGIDKMIEDNKEEIFEYDTDNIINKYLINGEKIDLNGFNINDYDISILINISKCGITLKDKNILKILKDIINVLIDLWSDKSLRYNWSDIIEYNNLHSLKEFFKKKFLDINEFNDLLDIMFNEVDLYKLEHNSLEFYNDIFFSLSPSYFDAYEDPQERRKIEIILKKLEEKIQKMDDGYQKIELYKSLVLTIPRFSNNWLKYKTKFTLRDKDFLNEQFIKYGEFCLDEMLITLYQFHTIELLPELLISLSVVFNKLYNKNEHLFRDIIYKRKFIIVEIISNAYLKIMKK